MKKLTVIPLILFLFICISCDTKQKGPTHLEVGRSTLIDKGNAVEAINNYLLEAEKKEEDKAEPRALLVIAYSHALASRATRGQEFESEYERQKEQRIAALNDAEMDKMIEILSKRSEVQQNGFQVFVEKGTDAAKIIIKHLGEGTYPKIHNHLTNALVKMKSNAVNPILDSIADASTPLTTKMELIHVLGEIGDKTAIERLKSIDMTNMTAALKMEFYTTLYRLGDSSYKSQIVAGLTSDKVEVRRAAAKAMSNLKNINTSSLINALKDNDQQVVMEIVKALAVHKTKAAVQPLVNVLKSESQDDDSEVQHSIKQEVLNTLTTYVHAGGELKRGIAKTVAELLINKEISSDNVRLRIVTFLQDDVLKKSLKALKLTEDIYNKLYTYAQQEESDFVRKALFDLLEEIK